MMIFCWVKHTRDFLDTVVSKAPDIKNTEAIKKKGQLSALALILFKMLYE